MSTQEIRLNLGCGRDIKEGWVNIDSVKLPGVDLKFDFEKCGKKISDDYAPYCLPYCDNAVDEMLLSHTLEHIQNSLGLMQELHRIAKPGSLLTVRVPYGSSDDADEDPTHVRRYFIGSWGYFSQPFYWRADYGYRGDWKVERLTLVVSKAKYGPMLSTATIDPQAILQSVYSLRNVVQEMVVVLSAVKPIREPLKELQPQTVVYFEYA